MLVLNYLVKRTALGKAMRATAQDMDAAKMMGVDIDRVIVLTFFLGSALAGAGSLFFGFYYGFTAFYIGYQTGLRAFTSAVLGGIGNIPGAVARRPLIGLIQALGRPAPRRQVDRRHDLLDPHRRDGLPARRPLRHPDAAEGLTRRERA